MRTVGDAPGGLRVRGLIVLLWRAGPRISEALALAETDPWLEVRNSLPVGALLCVIHGPTAGRHWEASAARKQLHHSAAVAGVRRRFAPHQLPHAHAIEMAHEGIPLVVIQQQHANLGITSIYLQGLDSSEIIDTVHSRPGPTIGATAALTTG